MSTELEMPFTIWIFFLGNLTTKKKKKKKKKKWNESSISRFNLIIQKEVPYKLL